MSFSSTTARVAYSGDGSTVEFSVTFPFQANADLAVVLTTAGVDTTQTLNTHYVVGGAGQDSGGTVRFTTAPASGTTVTIFRDVDLNQERSFAYNGAFPTATVTAAADKAMQAAQQINEKLKRTFRIAETNAEIAPLTIAQRAGKIPGFDSTGLPAMYEPEIAVLPNGAAYDVPTIAALKAINTATVPANKQIAVGGYYSPGDGGGGVFYFNSSSSATDNGGTIIAPVAGDGRWIRIYEGAVNVCWFGADKTGASDSAIAFQSAVNLAAAGDLLNTRRGLGVFLPGGNYKISTKVTLKTGVRIYGESRQSVRVVSHVSNDDLFFYDADATAANVAKDVQIENFSIIGAVASTGAYVRITGATDLSFPSISMLYIYGSDVGNYGIRVNNTINHTLSNVVVQGCASHGFFYETTNNGAVFTSCYATGNGGDGWRVAGTQMTFNGTASDSNDGHGYRLTGTGFTLNSPEAEDNAGDIIYLNGTYNTAINSGVIYGSSRSLNGITLDGAISTSIINTQIAEQGGTPSGYTLRYINGADLITSWQLITSAFASGTLSNAAGATALITVGTSGNLSARSLTSATKSFFNDMRILGLVPFANNAAAISGGLVAGDLYRIGDTVAVVH